MKLQMAVVKCFLVAVTVASAVGDQEGGATSSTAAAERVCPPEAEQQVPMHLIIVSIGQSCYDALTGNTTKWQRHNITKESIQTYFNSMCMNEICLRDCLEEKASSLELCENQTILKTFNIFRELIVKTIASGCAEGGKRFVTLMQGVQSIPVRSPIDDQFRVCSLKPFMIFTTVIQSNVDISSKLFILYKELFRLQECLSNVELDQSFREVLDYFANEIVTTMKCIHPQDETFVTCASIDVDLISVPSVCEVKTYNTSLDLYNVLGNEAAKCFDTILTYDDRDIDTSDPMTLRRHLASYCFRNKHGRSCLDEAKFYSDTCLSGTLKTEFKMFIDAVKRGLDAACLEDGKRLGEVMFEVYRLKRSGHGHAVRDCGYVARTTTNQNHIEGASPKNVRFYHETKAFEECIVYKLNGDRKSVDAAKSLVDEMLKNLECVSADGGSAVTCESLMQHQL